MNEDLKNHLLELLLGTSAHIDLKTVLKDFPIKARNVRFENLPYTAWELLEHIRIAQWDILEFSRDEKHISPEFPEGYWNRKKASEEDWKNSIRQVLGDLQKMRNLISDPKTDLFAKIPHGSGQTILREALLIADHNAYHLGQIVSLWQIIENKGEFNAAS